MSSAREAANPALAPLDGSPLSVSSGSQDHAGLDGKLFVAVSLILALLGALCTASLIVQVHTYLAAIQHATQADDTSGILSLTRALDAAIVKTSALFLGYVLVFTGALYILRIATAHYRLSVKSGRTAGNLDTSSPGLVMLTLGVLLVITAIVNKSSVEYGHETEKPPIAASPAGQVGNPMASQPGGLGSQ